RRLPARRDAVPDRLPDGRAPAGVGRRDAGAPAAGAARARAGPPPPGARVARAGGVAVLGRGAQTLWGASLRPRLERRPRRRAGSRRGSGGTPGTVRIAVLSPVWFPVPPTGYG